jgi:hypothetical protein
MAGGNKSNSAKTKKRKLQERTNAATKRDAERAKRSAFRTGAPGFGNASRPNAGPSFPIAGEQRE